MNSLQEILKVLIARDDFTIITHEIPDGDGIGSAIALYLALKKAGKKVQFLCADPIPPLYHHLKGIEEIVHPELMEQAPGEVIYLDCSDQNRVGRLSAYLREQHLSINIDHHADNNLFADFNHIDPGAAATGEIIFELIRLMDIEVDRDIANALYAAILMDTGSFRYGNTTARSHRITAQLFDLGADHDATRNALFESKEKTEILLIKKALDSLDFSADGRVAWMMLTYEEVETLDALTIHPEGLINYARIIKGVEIGLLFRELSPGLVKVGFRSKGKFDVARIAAHFNGGGHCQAAGATIPGSVMEVKDRVVSFIESVIG